MTEKAEGMNAKALNEQKKRKEKKSKAISGVFKRNFLLKETEERPDVWRGW